MECVDGCRCNRHKDHRCKSGCTCLRHKPSWNKGLSIATLYPESFVKSEEWKRKIGDGNRGKYRSPELRAILRAAKLGTKDSDEVRLKKRLAHLGNKNNVTPAGRKVMQENGRRTGWAGRGIPNPNAVKAMLLAQRNTTRPERFLTWQLAESMYGEKVLINYFGIPGRPDAYIPSLRLAVFHDGCRFHYCSKHRDAWARGKGIVKGEKEKRTYDRRINRNLKDDGYRVIRIWEHDVLADPSFKTMVKQIKLDQRREKFGTFGSSVP